MHLVIISGAARLRAKSNTAKIIAAFQKGYEEGGNTTEVWYLSDHSQWAGAAQAFERSDNILIALPLYVENIPGILLEFLSGLRPNRSPLSSVPAYSQPRWAGSVSRYASQQRLWQASGKPP